MLKLFFGSMIGRIIAVALVGLVAAGITYHFYTLGVEAAKTRKVTGERDASDGWISVVCASVGTPPQTKPELYRPACQETIRRLFSFYTKANSETTKALVQAEQDRVKKLEEDNRVKAQQQQALTAQLRRLKEISVNVKDDQVGPDYWAAVNRTAGLRPSVGTEGGSSGHDTDSGGHVDAAPAPDRIGELLESTPRVPGNS